MAQAELKEVLAVDTDKLFSIITRYEDYPQFVDGCTQVKVVERSTKNVRVIYHVSVMSQDVVYTLDHQENRETGRVDWSLVESNFFKKNHGSWQIKSLGKDKSDVLYSLDIEFKISVPGFILNRLVKGSLPGMVRSFEKQANRKS